MKRFAMVGAACLSLGLGVSVAHAGYWSTEWVWVPSKIANAKKGDVLLHAGTHTSIVGELLEGLGSWFTHTGMVVDNGYTIRHNASYPEEFRTTTYGMPWEQKIEPVDLRNALPGMLTESVDRAYNFDGSKDQETYKILFKVPNGAIVKPTSASESAWRPTMNAAADKMSFLSGYYRFYAYTDQEYTTSGQIHMPNAARYYDGKGSHCSGSVWTAYKYAGVSLGMAHVPNSVTQPMAYVLHDAVFNSVSDGNWLAGVSAAYEVADQVVNCFGWDECHDIGNWWEDAVTTHESYATAPDHLLLSSYVNGFGKKIGQNTASSSPLQVVEPISISGGYWAQRSIWKNWFVHSFSNNNSHGWSYSDDAFWNVWTKHRGTGSINAKAYASGYISGGALRIELGGIDDKDFDHMSGGFQQSLSSNSWGPWIIEFDASIEAGSDLDNSECVELLVAVDDELYGQNGIDYLAKVCDGDDLLMTTFKVQTGVLAPGSHTISLGAYLNEKDTDGEWATVTIDNVKLHHAGNAL